ncbi:hypothetical protein DSO57_1027789 [Entomophthora muscae]|uniref:Uncharacterized protein n=1 Tax=Entomophthora muscae TaxID=34485 RepID=A0ACC2T1K7_9FUNG|nr:hypothetical protein DSO57_1027789 [Entomophthora muscae]
MTMGSSPYRQGFYTMGLCFFDFCRVQVFRQGTGGAWVLAWSLKGGRSRLCVRIDNSPPLEPQAQERESNPELGFPQAAGLMDRGTTRPHFSGVEPPQADAEDDGPPSETD